jgi:hypothetical protein
MDHWNHRVVKRTSRWKSKDGKEHKSVWYQIEECFYEGKRKTPFAFTEGKAVGGESIKEIEWTLKQMLKCLKRPIINGDKK